MPRQIDHRSRSPYPADQVFAVMVDADYLRARLAKLGGPGAELLEHSANATSGRYRLRHGVDKQDLPPLVGGLVSGNLVIERTESLRREADGRYGGTVDVAIPGTPASAKGSIRITDTPGGSELVVQADVTVAIPLLGGRIEAVIADQVKGLLVAETAFTLDWLAAQKA